VKLVLTVMLFISALYFRSTYFTSELIMHNLWIVAIFIILCTLWIIFKVYRSMRIKDNSVRIQLLDDWTEVERYDP